MTIQRYFSAHLYRQVKRKLVKYRVIEGFRTYKEAKDHARHADGYNIQSCAIITE